MTAHIDGMQLTWLDLLAANMGAMLWLWAVMSARRWVTTERKKFIPIFILGALVFLGLAIFTSRASYWYDARFFAPIIVPPVASQ